MSRVFLFSVLMAAFVVSQGVSADNGRVVSPEVGARITGCLQGLLKDSKSHRPTTSDLKLGQEWVCNKILYLKTGSGRSDEMQILVLEHDITPLAYRFQDQDAGFLNTEGSALGSSEGHAEYLPYSTRGMDGLLGIPFGVKNGFFWDFLRMNTQGELVSEESILDDDIPNYIVSGLAPSALATDRHKVYAYSVCKSRTATKESPAFSCFE